jgi:hypothetical protein
MVSGYDRHYTYNRRNESKLHSPEITHAVSARPAGITRRFHRNDGSLNADHSKGGYTLVTLPCIVTPYRDSVDGTRDRVTYQKLVTRSRYKCVPTLRLTRYNKHDV